MNTATLHTPRLPSRLPTVGTTIFTVMSALASESGAVNLGQGFPDFDCDPGLLEHVGNAMREGLNQYPPMAGVPALRQVVARKIGALYGHDYDADSEITITAGATQAILTAVLCCVHPGDEVIVLEPCYDSYAPNIELAGGVVVRVPLRPGTFRPDFGKIAAAMTPKTRAIIVNSPHNPSATVWTRAEMEQLAALLHGTEVLLISDEVYEHMVFDGVAHVSAASIPALAARSFVVSSFGKTFHVTGWKVGTVAAPAPLTAEFRKVHQFNVFTVNTPMQHALARYMADPAPYLDLPAFYQRKRDLFRAGLAQTRLRPLPSEGTYFQVVDYSAVSALPEAEFCQWLTREIGVAAIPLSAFYEGGFEQGVARLCFAKRDETLNTALQRLVRI
jgi:methionine aminotransferase